MSVDDQCFHNNVQAEQSPYRLICEGCGVEVFAEPGGGYTDRDGEPTFEGNVKADGTADIQYVREQAAYSNLERLTLSPSEVAAVRVHEPDEAELFERLADTWELERPRGVDIADMAMHPAYQRIIGMGPRAVPLLLNRMERKPGHWFWALHAITGADPVPPENQGDIQAMTAAWLAWGRQHRHDMD